MVPKVFKALLKCSGRRGCRAREVTACHIWQPVACAACAALCHICHVWSGSFWTTVAQICVSSVYHLCIICVSSMSSVCQGILPCTGSSGGELKQLLFYFDQTRQEQPRGHCESSQAVEQFLTLYLDILDIFTALDFTPIFGCWAVKQICSRTHRTWEARCGKVWQGLAMHRKQPWSSSVFEKSIWWATCRCNVQRCAEMCSRRARCVWGEWPENWAPKSKHRPHESMTVLWFLVKLSWYLSKCSHWRGWCAWMLRAPWRQILRGHLGQLGIKAHVKHSHSHIMPHNAT